MPFSLTPTNITLHTYEYIGDVHIDHTLEYNDKRVLDHPVEIPEIPNLFPKFILIQLPNNQLIPYYPLSKPPPQNCRNFGH